MNVLVIHWAGKYRRGVHRGAKRKANTVVTHRSNSRHLHWLSVLQYQMCRSCWCPISFGSLCHARHHTVFLHWHPCTQYSSRKEREKKRVKKKKSLLSEIFTKNFLYLLFVFFVQVLNMSHTSVVVNKSFQQIAASNDLCYRY